jgi:hypothetical protein
MKTRKNRFIDRQQLAIDFDVNIRPESARQAAIVTTLDHRRDQKKLKARESTFRRLLQFARQLP